MSNAPIAGNYAADIDLSRQEAMTEGMMQNRNLDVRSTLKENQNSSSAGG